MAGVYGAPIASIQQAAAELAPFCEGSNAEEVAAFLSNLGGIGAGLHELMRADQNIGGIFRAVYSLNMLAQMVLANHCNCQRLCVLGHDVLGVLDNAGRRGAALRSIGVEALTACFEDVCTMVDAFTRPGWLLRLACDTHLREEFETLHQAVLELVKGEGLLSLAGARPPVAVDYRDYCRPLKRLLKQMGSGSITAGVQQLRVNDHSCVEVARLLSLQFHAVKEEAQQLPQSDLELETLYHQLLGDSIIDTPGRLSDACRSRPGSRASSRRGSHADFSDSQAAAGGLGRRSSSSFSLSISGPAAASLYGDLFRWYDRNKSGALERGELQLALQDLGMLDGKKTEDVREIITNQMRIADAAAFARGEGIGFDAFCKFYETLVMAKARQQLRFKLGLQVEEDLRTTFLCFAGFGSREAVTDMDSAHFKKLCNDCGLLDKHTGITEIDLVFCYVKNKGARRITFEQFLTALSKLAERKGFAFEDVVMKVLTAGGPVTNASVQPEYVRLHDDKSTFTGVYARGGPNMLDQSGFELKFLVDRSLPETAKRNGGSPSTPGNGIHPSRRTNGLSAGGSAFGNSGSSPLHGAPPSPSSNHLSRANSANGSTTPFASFSGGVPMHSPRGEAILQHRRLSNAGPVEGSGFKLFNRRGSGAAAVAAATGGSAAAASGSSSVAASSAAAAGVVGGGSSNSSSSPALQSPPLGARATSATCSASIIDNQAGQQLPVTPAAVTASTPGAAADQAAAAATQDCQDFQAAQAAANLGRTRSAIPSTSLTPSLGSSSRWYSQGILGPVTAPAGGATGSSSSSRRGSVDAAGVDSAKAVRRNSRGGVPGSSGSSADVQLRDVFAAFAGFGIRSPACPTAPRLSTGGMPGGGLQKLQQQGDSRAVFKPLVLEMDGFRFVKLCREAGMFDDSFTSTGADIIFTKVKTKGAKKISYPQFMTALCLIASVKKVVPHELVDAVLRCGAPTLNSSCHSNAGCTPDLVRMHDSR